MKQKSGAEINQPEQKTATAAAQPELEGASVKTSGKKNKKPESTAGRTNTGQASAKQASKKPAGAATGKGKAAIKNAEPQVKSPSAVKTRPAKAGKSAAGPKKDTAGQTKQKQQAAAQEDSIKIVRQDHIAAAVLSTQEGNHVENNTLPEAALLWNNACAGMHGTAEPAPKNAVKKGAGKNKQQPGRQAENQDKEIGYHAASQEQKSGAMKVLFAASESAPFIKVGGLGDVMGALPKALAARGVDARVVLPLYSQIGYDLRDTLEFVCWFEFKMAWRNSYCGVFRTVYDGVTFYFIDNEQYFKRTQVYGEYDDGERFAYFSRAVLELFPNINFYPDVIHANDWHTALVPVYLDVLYRANPGYGGIKTVFSIHNIEFQGKYDPYILGSVFGLGVQCKNTLYDGECLNLMKGAIECANIVTTVSPNYAGEILDPYFSWGLDGILNARKYKLRGILNGIDTDVFDPAADPAIQQPFDLQSVEKRTENKRALQRQFGLPERPEAVIIGMVTRLTPQKGIELFYPVMNDILNKDVQLIVLGSGYSQFEDYFRSIQNYYPEKCRAYIGFSTEIASKIYAGADLFLMPSKSEPCGLSQMIAMRYGAIPVVHEIGGLRDTVSAYNPETGNGVGVTFKSFNSYDMADAVSRAYALVKEPRHCRQLIKNAMSSDFSWKISAGEYLNIYNMLTGK